jgi:hypothetical protein
LFHDFLYEKYADQHPDLIALNFVGNLVAAEKFLQRLFPGVRVLLAGLTGSRGCFEFQDTEWRGKISDR